MGSSRACMRCSVYMRIMLQNCSVCMRIMLQNCSVYMRIMLKIAACVKVSAHTYIHVYEGIDAHTCVKGIVAYMTGLHSATTKRSLRYLQRIDTRVAGAGGDDA